MDRQLVQYYRTAENYLRYLPGDAEREHALASFFQRHRRYFGRSVLDLACGGGVLGTIVAPTGRRYVGVDANPDMIRGARESSKTGRLRLRFLLGDACRVAVPGRYDTLTLLGNGLGHVRPSEMEELLVRRASNVHRGSTFVIDYRDVVAMFWDGAWTRKPYVQTHKRGKVVHRTRAVDFTRGVIRVRSRPAGGAWAMEFTQAIWSPFILEVLMGAHGWRLARRTAGRSTPESPREPYLWEDVYRFRSR